MKKETVKKIMITAIGAPPAGYNTVLWQVDGRDISEPLPFILMAFKHQIDHLIILGTDKSFDESRPHYIQLTEALQKYGLAEKYTQLAISDLRNTGEFWDAFHTIINNPQFRKGKIELYVDLTFGYRIQPMLIFLAAFFLNEMNEQVTIKKIYYGMHDAQPPQILDMTELVYLLEWLKASQMFVEGGSAKALAKNFFKICGDEFQGVAKNFREFADAYSFNYVSDLKQKAANFQKEYKNKNFRRNIRNNFPVFDLIHPFLNAFINSFFTEDEVAMQLKTAERNFSDEAYSRAVIILREVYITFFMSALNLMDNDSRLKVERLLINRIYFSLFDEEDNSSVSAEEREEARKIFELLKRSFSEQALTTYYVNWGAIREIRNNSGHIRNIDRGDKKKYYSKFEGLKAELQHYLESTQLLYEEMKQNLPLSEKTREELKNFLFKDSDKGNDRQLFVVVNEGLHPILPALKEQFGTQITVEVLTRGNVDLEAEKEIAQKCLRLAEKYREFQIYLVPSGFPYLAVAAYNVLQQTLARHPIWLQFDRESGKYREKNLDPRRLISAKE